MEILSIFAVEQVRSTEPGKSFVPGESVPRSPRAFSLFNQRTLLSDAEPVLPINSRKVTPSLGQHRDRVRLKQGTDHAALMLTSGSSGNSKDVYLKHGQILAAIAGNESFSRNSSWTSIERD